MLDLAALQLDGDQPAPRLPGFLHRTWRQELACSPNRCPEQLWPTGLPRHQPTALPRLCVPTPTPISEAAWAQGPGREGAGLGGREGLLGAGVGVEGFAGVYSNQQPGRSAVSAGVRSRDSRGRVWGVTGISDEIVQPAPEFVGFLAASTPRTRTGFSRQVILVHVSNDAAIL